MQCSPALQLKTAPPHQLSRSLSPPAQPSNDDDGAAEPSHNMTNWAQAGSNNVITELRRHIDQSKQYKCSRNLICVPGQGRGPPLLIYCRRRAAGTAPPPSPAAGRGGTRPAHAPSPNPLAGGGIGAAHCKQLDGLKIGVEELLLASRHVPLVRMFTPCST